MLVRERVLAPRDVRSILGVDRPIQPTEAGGYVSADEASRLFEVIRAKVEERRRAKAEREKDQGHLHFGGDQ
jgi:hypothetical protein